LEETGYFNIGNIYDPFTFKPNRVNKESVSIIVDTLLIILNINYFFAGTAGLAGVFAASGFSPKFGATTPGSACFAC